MSPFLESTAPACPACGYNPQDPRESAPWLQSTKKCCLGDQNDRPRQDRHCNPPNPTRANTSDARHGGPPSRVARTASSPRYVAIDLPESCPSANRSMPAAWHFGSRGLSAAEIDHISSEMCTIFRIHHVAQPDAAKIPPGAGRNAISGEGSPAPRCAFAAHDDCSNPVRRWSNASIRRPTGGSPADTTLKEPRVDRLASQFSPSLGRGCRLSVSVVSVREVPMPTAARDKPYEARPRQLSSTCHSRPGTPSDRRCAASSADLPKSAHQWPSSSGSAATTTAMAMPAGRAKRAHRSFHADVSQRGDSAAVLAARRRRGRHAGLPYPQRSRCLRCSRSICRAMSGRHPRTNDRLLRLCPYTLTAIPADNRWFARVAAARHSRKFNENLGKTGVRM